LVLFNINPFGSKCVFSIVSPLLFL